MSSRISNDEIALACQQLEGEPPETVLRWAVDRFGEKLLFSTAFGPEGCCILHMLADIGDRRRKLPPQTVVQRDVRFQLPTILREQIDRGTADILHLRRTLPIGAGEPKQVVGKFSVAKSTVA